jgi:uncharacterized glyoxalase superfamily protein PhnB
MADWKPQGTHCVTPHLVVKGAVEALDFYTRAFGAVELARMPMGGLIGHAEMQFGDSRIFLADEWPGGTSASPKTLAGTSVVIHLYVEDVDASFQRAVGSGASVLMPPMDMFWGDRYAQVRCPFGHVWSLATHKEDLSFEEMGRRGEEFMKQMPPPAPAKAKPARKPAKKAKAASTPAKVAKKPAPRPAKKAARKPAPKKQAARSRKPAKKASRRR